MTGKKSRDPFTYHVMARIDPAVRASFTPRQIEALEEAISKGDERKNRFINFRGSVPLLFARYYLVVLAGRDLRYSVRSKEKKLQKKMTAAKVFLLSFFICWPALLVLFIVLYLLKRWLHIDFLPDTHLFEMLGL